MHFALLISEWISSEVSAARQRLLTAGEVSCEITGARKRFIER